jgi:AraC-like DNA-binding protein
MVGFGPAATIAAIRDAGQRGVRTWTLADFAAAVPGAADGRPHRVDHHLMLLVTAGHGRMGVDFVGYRCRPGTLLWVRPGQVLHCLSTLDAVVITWPAAFLPALPVAPWSPEDPFGPARWQLAGEDQDAVIDEVSQLVVDCGRFSPGEAPAAMLRHQLAVLVLRVAMMPPATPSSPTPGTESTVDGEAYLRFRREIEEGYAESRRVESYAERLGCSVRTLTRACLAATGRSAKQVLDDRVALEAKRLLACTELPVAAVGEQLGFPEPTHFGRFFHREVGCPPGAFRAAVADGEPRLMPRSRA